MKLDLSLFKGKGEGFLAGMKKSWPLLAALLLGLLLLSLPRGGAALAQSAEETPAFSLAEEEAKLARALSRIGDVGQVTVTLSLSRSMEWQIARDETSRSKTLEGGGELQTESEAVRLQAGSGGQTPVTLRYLYPEYRGALVIAERLDPASKLEIINAVAALTGLTTDKITVTTGK